MLRCATARVWNTGFLLGSLASAGLGIACSGGDDGSGEIVPFDTQTTQDPNQPGESGSGSGDMNVNAGESGSSSDGGSAAGEGTSADNGVSSTGQSGSNADGAGGSDPSNSDGAGGDDSGDAANNADGSDAASGDADGDTGGDTAGNTAEPPSLDAVLVFSSTAGYRHESIQNGREMMQQLGQSEGFAVTLTEAAGDFSDDNLAQFDVVVWLSTTGDVLNEEQQGAFERYLQAGGGYVGVHSASDTEYDWAWYGALLGNDAYFASHPEIQTAQISVEQQHVSTAHLSSSFQLEDELYNFQNNPRPSVSVLLTLDENSYFPRDNAMGEDHPISWYHEYDGGRAWYTGLGHQPALYTNPVFTQHVLGGVRWAAGVAQ